RFLARMRGAPTRDGVRSRDAESTVRPRTSAERHRVIGMQQRDRLAKRKVLRAVHPTPAQAGNIEAGASDHKGAAADRTETSPRLRVSAPPRVILPIAEEYPYRRQWHGAHKERCSRRRGEEQSLLVPYAMPSASPSSGRRNRHCR